MQRTEPEWAIGPDIDGMPGRVGNLVFWRGAGRKPWWIVEWQPTNGMSFAIVDAAGVVGVAAPEELTRDFRNAGGQ